MQGSPLTPTKGNSGTLDFKIVKGIVKIISLNFKRKTHSIDEMRYREERTILTGTSKTPEGHSATFWVQGLVFFFLLFFGPQLLHDFL